jgi:glycolate oxidase
MTEIATASVLDALRSELALTTDPDVLESYRRDQAPEHLVPAGTPLAVAHPRTAEEVRIAVTIASRHGVPVVPRGAGSGLSGGANAVDGCLMLVLDRLTRISIAPDRLTATVGAGVINTELRSAAARHGLLYAPDPASADYCTIGGNVATNAGGLCCVKHGVTGDALLALEVVLADGRLVRFGHETRKDVAGYDLVALLCGSEGTLGIVTEAVVQLTPLGATQPATMVASFAQIADAGRAVGAIMRRHVPSMLEIMDRATINAVEDFQPMELDRTAGALLFARTDEGLAAADAIAALCEEAGADFAVTSDEAAEGRMLTAARRLAYPALERLGDTLLDDIAVPLDRIPELLDGIAAIGVREQLTIGTFGHAGDGNMHPTLVFDRDDPAARERAARAFDAILDLACDLGGTVTGEHGVGTLKRDAVRRASGAQHDVHMAIKAALDPAGILNPGKAV